MRRTFFELMQVRQRPPLPRAASAPDLRGMVEAGGREGGGPGGGGGGEQPGRGMGREGEGGGGQAGRRRSGEEEEEAEEDIQGGGGTGEEASPFGLKREKSHFLHTQVQASKRFSSDMVVSWL